MKWGAIVADNRAQTGAAYRPFGAFRLFLAILVTGQHFGWLAPLPLGDHMPRYATGDIAVLTFFALSGFIITEAAVNYYDRRPWAFAINRSLRIVPALLLALMLSVAAHIALLSANVLTIPEYVGDPSAVFAIENLLKNLAYAVPALGDVATPDYRFIPYTWAIRTELVFYGVVFLAIMLMRTRLSHSLAIAAVGGGVAYAAFHLGLGPGLFRFVVYFCLGGSLYFALTGSRAGALLAAIFFALCLLDYQSYNEATHSALAERMGPRPWAAQYALLAGCLLAIPALYFVRIGPRAARIDRWLGDLSYPLYLNQYVVLILLYSMFGRDWLAFVIALPVALLVSYAAKLATEPAVKPIRDRVRGVSLG